MSAFKAGQRIRHKTRGTFYVVVFDRSHNLRIEQAQDLAYAYKTESGGVTWVRPATEMEDGRFEAAE